MAGYACVAGVAVALPAGTKPGDPVVDALLYALTAAQRSSTTQPLLDAVVADLALLGFATGSSTSSSTTLRPRDVPLTKASGAPSFVGPTLAAVRRAPSAVRAAFAGFAASEAGAATTRACAQVTTSAGEVGIVLALLELSPPADDAAGFPWAPVTAPATLTLRTASLTADPVVWTPAVARQLAQKVAALQHSVLTFS
jgi:hypothetical protein